MAYLCIDTSGRALTMALWDENSVLASRSDPALQRHSELLTAVLDSLLYETGLSVKDIGTIAVINGPGSFTGLRVGISYAKGLAMGLGAKLVALNTLDAMACSSGIESGLIAPMLDAKRKQVYTALYDMSKGPFAEMKPPVAVEPEKWLEELPEGTAVLGSGAQAYRGLIESISGSGLKVLEGPEEPTPKGMIKLARFRMEKGDFTGIDELDAFYIRQADAELKAGRR